MPSSPSPYRSLPAERRISLVAHSIKESKESRAHYVQRLAERPGGFRAVTLRTWPVERLAREVVRVGAESAVDELDLLQSLYVDLEPAIQITFLDAAGVGHAGGSINDTLEPPYADAETVRRAAAAVVDQHGEDGVRYLRTLARYNLAAWPGIDAVAAEVAAQ